MFYFSTNDLSVVWVENKSRLQEHRYLCFGKSLGLSNRIELKFPAYLWSQQNNLTERSLQGNVRVCHWDIWFINPFIWKITKRLPKIAAQCSVLDRSTPRCPSLQTHFDLKKTEKLSQGHKSTAMIRFNSSKHSSPGDGSLSRNCTTKPQHCWVWAVKLSETKPGALHSPLHFNEFICVLVRLYLRKAFWCERVIILICLLSTSRLGRLSLLFWFWKHLKGPLSTCGQRKEAGDIRMNVSVTGSVLARDVRVLLSAAGSRYQPPSLTKSAGPQPETLSKNTFFCKFCVLQAVCSSCSGSGAN